MFTNTFHAVPQKLPTFEFPTTPAEPFEFAQGLPLKQFRPMGQTPSGHGILSSHFCAWSAHDVPQKLVFTTGDFEGKGVVGRASA